MTLISSTQPADWKDLEDSVAGILRECGMNVRQQVRLELLRGHFDADVVADETVQGISHNIICECKFWDSNIPAEKVRAFRVTVEETGANRGYVVSRRGFQSGAIEAAQATNIELVTYEQFQELYFQKWFQTRIKAVETAIGNFNVYYEPRPMGRCGYELLERDDERAAYLDVWNRYFFAGLMLSEFSPYRYLFLQSDVRPPALPLALNFDQPGLGGPQNPLVPDDVKNETGYRELLDLLENYARQGLSELRAVNPRFKGTVNEEQVQELDQPMPKLEGGGK